MEATLRDHMETHLLETEVGYDVLDAIVQANVDIASIPPEELERIVAKFSSKRQHGTHSRGVSPK